ncbi:MAG: quinoprotein dehydrogenase-associated SoxYZ-like carrier [Burkholderiales bacterium]
MRSLTVIAAMHHWIICCLLVCATSAQAQDAGPSWQQIKQLMFGERPVNTEAKRVVELFVPQRAEDAAVVPILIRARMQQTPERFIRHLWLVIDNNPSPFGVKFTLTPESGKADIETRVRLESASPIRVVAELNDGTLWMDSKMVFGAGGCSSASAKSEAVLRNLGRVRFSVDEQFASKGDPLLAHLRVSHPQFTGMGSDNPDPPRYVRQVKVFHAQKLVLSADLDFTISENPSFRFYFLPDGVGELRAYIEDSDNLKIEQQLEVDPAKVMLN